MLEMISQFLPFNSVSRVQILDNETLMLLLDSLSPVSVSVEESKTVTKFAVEDGTERSDHVIENPIEISIDFVIHKNLKQDFNELKTAFEQNRLLTIQTKTNVYSNMLISNISQAQDSDKYDAVNVSVDFTEWVEVTPEYGELKKSTVKNPVHADAINRGAQQAKKEPSAFERGFTAGYGE